MSRERDKLVAEHVFGWQLTECLLHPVPRWEWVDADGDKLPYWHENREDAIYQLPHFSTSIADAWTVVERMGLSVLSLEGTWIAGKLYQSVYFDSDTEVLDGHLGNNAEADTAPMAIALAALKAAGVEIPANA